MINRTAQGLAADAMAALSGTGAAVSWVVQANGVLQMLATGVAIVAGVYAIKWHRLRIKNEQSKRNNSE